MVARLSARLPWHNAASQAMDYLLKRWPAFTPVLDDGRICLSDDAAERALRSIALRFEREVDPATLPF